MLFMAFIEMPVQCDKFYDIKTYTSYIQFSLRFILKSIALILKYELLHCKLLRLISILE